MTTRIKLRRDTATNWTNVNPVLALGEPGYDTTNNKLKVGDGVTAWNSLGYLTDQGGAGAGVVEREISFPTGDSGDTRGTIALTPDGNTYICTADWEDATAALQGTFTASTFEAYNVGQSGGSFNSAVLSIQDYPELYNILRYGFWNEGELTVNAGPDFGGAQNVVNTNYNDQSGIMSFVWLHREQDPSDIAQGTSVTIVYTGSGNQLPIWKKLVDVTWSGGEGEGTITWSSQGDLTIETLRPTGYVGDCDVNIYGADDVWIQAKGDEAEIKAFSDVRIVSNDGIHQWTFTQSGSLQLPDRDNTGYQPGYGLNGPTLMLGGENDPYDQVIVTGPVPNTDSPNAQRIVIQGQKGFGGNNQAGEGGDIYLWGGTGGESNSGNVSGDGGDIKIRGGAGQFGGAGGYVKIEGGDTFYGPGGVGGFIEITAGDGQGGGNTDGGDVRIRAGRSQGTGNNGEVSVSTGVNSEFTWRFDNAGTLHLPTNADIVDSNGTSVLNGGPANLTIPSTIKGYYMLQGRRPNNADEVAFQNITAAGNYIYTLGLNAYSPSNWSDNVPVVQKIEKATGAVIWSKRIAAGRNAQFDIDIISGVVSINLIANAGVGYKAGEQLIISGDAIGGSFSSGNIIITVDTVDQSGAITAASVTQQPATPGADGFYGTVNVYGNNNNVQVRSIAYDPNGDQLVVTSQAYRGAWSQEDPNGFAYANIYVLNASTGEVNQTYTLKDLDDIDPAGVAVSSTGQIAVVGQKYNEYRSFGALTILAPGNGYFDILKSNLDPEHYPGSALPGDEAYNFFIQGTGIAYQEGVDNVNYYQNVSTTVREGSGASFDIINNGDGTYSASTVAASGTNYLAGHKIKIAGTALGGATTANDCTITVTTVTGSGGITAFTVSGAAAGVGSPVTYSGVTGNNFEVGSGAQLNIDISPSTGLITSIGTGNFGNYHYVVGDVLTVAGTTFANGTSPANDITVTVTDVYLGGPNGYDTPVGTVPSDALRIQVDGVNFNQQGSWSMRQTLAGEAFIWTPTWNKAIGSSNNDWFNSVAFSPDGNSIYAVGSGRYEVNYQQALVVKFAASNGAISWSKYVNSYLTQGSEVSAEAMSVVTLSDGKVVVAIGDQGNPDNGRQEHGLILLNADGTSVWAANYQEPTWNFDTSCQVLRDNSDNLYLVYRSYSGNSSDAYAILKVNSSNGATIWSRALSNGANGMYFEYNWGKNYAVINGDDIYVVGYTYIPNDNYYSALLIKFPTDGFKTFDAVGWTYGQQFGDLRVYELQIDTGGQGQNFPTFTPEVHADAITTAIDDKAFTAITDTEHPHTYLQYFNKDDLGYVEFGDGSKQSFATDKIPQILGSAYAQIKLSPQDSGKHFFFDSNCTNATIHIPSYDLEDPYPVGYTVTIVNCSGGDIYVQMEDVDNNDYYNGRIFGSGRNIQTRSWGIPDSGSGSLVTLMKVKDAQYTGGENESGPIWMIAGPSDLYDSY